jgi:hypothetical protein
MNSWLLGAAGALAVIGLVHSVMGERRIFAPWRAAPPRELPRRHQVMLRASWHLPTLLGLGLSAQLAGLATQGGALPWAGLLGPLALGVGACGLLVALATRGRHQGGTALLATAVLIVLGQWAGGAA